MNRSPATMRRYWFDCVLWSLVVLCWLGPPARAESEIACVRCSGPDQTYRCRAMSEDGVPTQALRYFCMSQIARDHVHESCAVLRNTASCDGLDVSYVYQDAAEPTAKAEGGAPAEQKEPGTLADMTRATVRASVNAGKAVGDATKRTLKCLGSALKDC